MLLSRLVNLPLHPERRCKLDMVITLCSSVFPVSLLSFFSFECVRKRLRMSERDGVGRIQMVLIIYQLEKAWDRWYFFSCHLLKSFFTLFCLGERPKRWTKDIVTVFAFRLVLGWRRRRCAQFSKFYFYFFHDLSPISKSLDMSNVTSPIGFFFFRQSLQRSTQLTL